MCVCVCQCVGMRGKLSQYPPMHHHTLPCTTTPTSTHTLTSPQTPSSTPSHLHSLPPPHPHIHFPDVTVEFSQSSYTANEGDRFVLLEISKNGVSQQDVEVDVVLQDLTARGGLARLQVLLHILVTPLYSVPFSPSPFLHPSPSLPLFIHPPSLSCSLHPLFPPSPGGLDYGPFPSSEVTLTFVLLGNSTAMQFGVAIREDSIVEEAENFSVRVELQEGGTPGVLIGMRSEAVVVIEDNDGACVHVHM